MVEPELESKPYGCGVQTWLFICRELDSQSRISCNLIDNTHISKETSDQNRFNMVIWEHFNSLYFEGKLFISVTKVYLLVYNSS